MINNYPVQDIHPRTTVEALRREFPPAELRRAFDLDLVAALCGMQPAYVRRALEKPNLTEVTLQEVLILLDLDAFAETFVPRSKVPGFLLRLAPRPVPPILRWDGDHGFFVGSALDLLERITPNSVQCVVTSPPYWGTRLYGQHVAVHWADDEICPFGHEQTPEAFLRHTTELLYRLKSRLSESGSVWWNLMDTYNTRTQIRQNAAETLHAMQGKDKRGWSNYTCRRYSAGHSFLKDGEQCLIPGRTAERAARIGYYVKSIVTWKKTGSMPETVETRVTRELEYVIHLSRRRNPFFDKAAYLRLPANLGGRNPQFEAKKLTDVWSLPTSSGTEGHGAQFPIALPGRCIALTSELGDLVLDLFLGSGNTSVAAARLGRKSLGFDVAEEYLEIARRKTKAATTGRLPRNSIKAVETLEMELLQRASGE